MPRVSSVLIPLLAATGAALVAYGGYGAGVVQATGGTWPYWLQVAGVMTAGSALVAASQLLRTRQAGTASTTFAAELAALERLVPTVRNHPDGLTVLQDLIDVVFEARLRDGNAVKSETLVERRAKEGRDHV